MHISARFSALGICVTLACFPTASNPASMSSKDRLLGPVHSVITKMPWQTVTIRLDRSGKVIEEQRNRPDSAEYSYKFLFTYDDRGREVECEIYERGKSFPEKKHTRYSEDKKGLPTAAVTVFDNGSLNQVTFYTYDDAERLSEEIQVLADGTALKTVFDHEGKLIHDAWYERHGYGLRSKSSYYYNARGQEIETISYGADGSVHSRCTTTYPSGRSIENVCEFDSPPERMMRSYDIDQAGNWIRSRTHIWRSYQQPEEYEEIIEREINYY